MFSFIFRNRYRGLFQTGVSLLIVSWVPNLLVNAASRFPGSFGLWLGDLPANLLSKPTGLAIQSTFSSFQTHFRRVCRSMGIGIRCLELSRSDKSSQNALSSYPQDDRSGRKRTAGRRRRESGVRIRATNMQGEIKYCERQPETWSRHGQFRDLAMRSLFATCAAHAVSLPATAVSSRLRSFDGGSRHGKKHPSHRANPR